MKILMMMMMKVQIQPITVYDVFLGCEQHAQILNKEPTDSLTHSLTQAELYQKGVSSLTLPHYLWWSLGSLSHLAPKLAVKQ